MTSLLLLFILMLSFLVMIALYYIYQLRRERYELNHQLRRVLRASTNRLDAQEYEIRMLKTICEVIPHPLFMTNFKKEVVQK